MTAGPTPPVTPAPRRLVLLRHGRTAYNHEGRIQGQRDVGLDEVGLAQAAAAAPYVAKLAPTLLWSSDLARAHTTAHAVAATTGLTVVADPRLRELSFGDSEGLTRDDFRATDPDSHAALLRGDYDQVAGAEPVVEVRLRMRAALTDLLAALAPGSTGVAVSHGAAIRVAIAELLGWSDDVFRSLGGLDNCGWAVLQESAHGAPLRLAAYNRAAPTVV